MNIDEIKLFETKAHEIELVLNEVRKIMNNLDGIYPTGYLTSDVHKYLAIRNLFINEKEALSK